MIIFEKLLDLWLGKTKKVLVSEQSLYQEAMTRWRLTTPPSHQIYRSLREVEVAFKTIDVYLKEMKLLKSALLNDSHYKSECELRVVKECDFYLTSDRGVLNIAETYSEFTHLASELLELYEERIDQIDKSAKLSSTLYNSRLMIQNLINLSEALPSY